MTHPFVKAYTAVCKELLAPLGFKCKGKYFYRVVDDVYQDLVLKRYSSGNWYSVYYGVFPFCVGFEVDATAVDGSVFALEHITKLPSYGNKTEEAYRDCAVKLGELIRTYIVPVFERAVNTAAAFAEWNRLLSPNEHCGSAYISMAIAIGDYDSAILGLENSIEIALDCYERRMREVHTLRDVNLNLKHYKPEPQRPGKTLEEIDRAFRTYKMIFRHILDRDMEWILANFADDEPVVAAAAMLRRVRARDMDWINNFIEENERKSRIALGLEKETQHN